MLIREKWGTAAYPPPLPLSESLEWRGFCKKALQNIERLGVKGQNLETKRVIRVLGVLTCTAFALAMIDFFKFRVKIRCNKLMRKTCRSYISLGREEQC